MLVNYIVQYADDRSLVQTGTSYPLSLPGHLYKGSWLIHLHSSSPASHVQSCPPLRPRRCRHLRAPVQDHSRGQHLWHSGNYSLYTPEIQKYLKCLVQLIGTGQTQGSQTIQYGYDNALAGLNFLNTGLQSTNTFGAATATNGLTAATNTATFGAAPLPYGLQGLNYGLGLGQQYFWG